MGYPDKQPQPQDQPKPKTVGRLWKKGPGDEDKKYAAKGYITLGGKDYFLFLYKNSYKQGDNDPDLNVVVGKLKEKQRSQEAAPPPVRDNPMDEVDDLLF